MPRKSALKTKIENRIALLLGESEAGITRAKELLELAKGERQEADLHKAEANSLQDLLDGGTEEEASVAPVPGEEEPEE